MGQIGPFLMDTKPSPLWEDNDGRALHAGLNPIKQKLL